MASDSRPGLALFDTPIGSCGIAWGPRGVRAFQLPEASAAATRKRLRERCPDAVEGPPPTGLRRTIAEITALLRGERRDLTAIALDMEGVPDFHRRVYEVARRIAPGRTLTYGEVAARVGAPGAARAVGQALGRNPFAVIVPCHRVLAAGGKSGGFSAGGGVTTKMRLLAIEGAGTTTAPRRSEPSATSRPPRAPRRSAAPAFDFAPAEALAHLRRADPTLGKLIAAVGPFTMQVKPTSSVFEALAEAIVHQQLSGKAAATIYGRVCALFPDAKGAPRPTDILGASEAELRGAGLSRPKQLALRDLAERTHAGRIPSMAQIRRLDDDTIVETLTEVRGIGRWTTEMLLMFRLGRPDVLPVDDFGVRKGYAIAYRTPELPAPKDLARLGERWAPYRTVAAWYLWRAVELGEPPAP